MNNPEKQSSDKPFMTIDVVDYNGQTRAIYPEARLSTRSRRDTAPKPTQAAHPPEWTSGFEWAPWGADDCRPNIICDKIFNTPIAGRAIREMAGMMYGNGLVYYKRSDLALGTKIQRHFDPTIEQWMKRNRLHTKWLIPQIVAYRFHMNTFSEMIFNRRKDVITGLFHKQTEFCRLAKMDEASFQIKDIIYSPYFGAGYPPPLQKRKRIPLFPWYDEENFLKKTPGFKFAYHTKLETPGTLYYARPFWLGLFKKNGWIDVNQAVPEIINSMMYNQVRLKYHILIPETYFRIRYRNEWDGLDDKGRQKIMDELASKIDKELSGTENAYMSVTTYFQEQGGMQEGKIEIVAVDDKIKADAWVPSIEQSNAQVVQGLGQHPSLIGIGKSGGPLSAGSGSDQREAFNTAISVNTIEQQILLEPLQFVADFNSRSNPAWDIVFAFDHTHHTTTNNQESGLQPSSNTIEIQ